MTSFVVCTADSPVGLWVCSKRQPPASSGKADNCGCACCTCYCDNCSCFGDANAPAARAGDAVMAAVIVDVASAVAVA